MFHLHNSHSRKRIAIIGGTGAVGAYFAQQLVNAGHSVSIIGKTGSQSLKHIQTNGLRLITTAGEFQIPAEKFSYVGDLALFPRKDKQDLVIISLKQFDMSDEIAQQILEITDGNSVIGVITNGLPFYFLRGLNFSKKHLDSVDDGGRITQKFTDRTIICIQPVIASTIVSPGNIQIIRPREKITVTLGYPENYLSRQIEEICDLFKRSHINTTITEDPIQKNILAKLQFALSLNTLSAIMEKSIGYIFDAPETQVLIRYSITLINQISIALGLGTLRSYEQFKSTIITKEHFSSLYYDIKAGKPGEVRAIVDATIEMANFLKNHNLHGKRMLDLGPLETLKELLAQKISKIGVNQLQLMKLFEACHKALNFSTENIVSRVRIPSKL